MENKVIITNDQYEINQYLDKGWIVKSVTAQYVATTSAATMLLGKFCFVLERVLNNN